MRSRLTRRSRLSPPLNDRKCNDQPETNKQGDREYDGGVPHDLKATPCPDERTSGNVFGMVSAKQNGAVGYACASAFGVALTAQLRVGGQKRLPPVVFVTPRQRSWTQISARGSSPYAAG